MAWGSRYLVFGKTSVWQPSKPNHTCSVLAGPNHMFFFEQILSRSKERNIYMCLNPRGSIYTTIRKLGPQIPYLEGVMGPTSVMVVYVDPLGIVSPRADINSKLLPAFCREEGKVFANTSNETGWLGLGTLGKHLSKPYLDLQGM